MLKILFSDIYVTNRNVKVRFLKWTYIEFGSFPVFVLSWKQIIINNNNNFCLHKDIISKWKQLLTFLFDHKVGELGLLARNADVGHEGEHVVLENGHQGLRGTRQVRLSIFDVMTINQRAEFSYPFVFVHDFPHTVTNGAHGVIAYVLHLNEFLEPGDQ